MKLDELHITKYNQESIKGTDKDFKEFGFQHYKYCNKKQGDVCENIHCLCATLHMGGGVTVTCGRKKYGN